MSFKNLICCALMVPVLAIAERIQITGVAATVNGKVITRKEVAVLLAPRMQVIQAKYPRGGEAAQKEFQEAQDNVLDQLIENKIILSELEDRGASIPDYVVDQEVKRIVNDLYNGNEADFRADLTKSGSTMRSYKEAHREKILVQALKSEQFGGRQAPPTKEEIQAKYNERKRDFRDRTQDKITFSKIFISILPNKLAESGRTAEMQLALAEELAQDLKKGEDFATYARKYSDGGYADDGGMLKSAPRTDFEPTFAQIVFDSPVGEVTGPYKDAYGFTIIKVHSIDYGPSEPLSKVKDRLIREIEAEKYQEKYEAWMEILKKKAIIDKRMN